MSSALIIDLESIWMVENTRSIDEAIKSPAKVVALNMLWDTPPADRWIPDINRWIADLRSAGKKTILIVNSWYKKSYQNLIEKSHADEIVFLDFFLVLVYVRLILKKESQVCQHWDPTSEKFLFLTGKPERKNRIGWIYRLYQDGLLDRCTWSLHVPDHVRKAARSFLPIQDDSRAYQWIDDFSMNPDDVSPITTGESIHYSGIPYGEIYQSSLFQVVSESFFTADPWITEKTWLPIINRKPFILASYPGTGCYQLLKDLGFLTFDEFLLDTKFDSIVYDDESRWESLIGNIRYWLDILPGHSDSITEILKHNYNLFIELAQKNIDLLRMVARRYGINENIDSLVRFYDPHQYASWQNWYSRIKDPSWPDCEREEDFQYLPERIQKECIEVFGYQPKT